MGDPFAFLERHGFTVRYLDDGYYLASSVPESPPEFLGTSLVEAVAAGKTALLEAGLDPDPPRRGFWTDLVTHGAPLLRTMLASGGPSATAADRNYDEDENEDEDELP